MRSPQPSEASPIRVHGEAQPLGQHPERRTVSLLSTELAASPAPPGSSALVYICSVLILSSLFHFCTAQNLLSIQSQQNCSGPRGSKQSSSQQARGRTNCPSVSHKTFIKNSWLVSGAVSNFQKNLQCIFPENRARKWFL